MSRVLKHGHRDPELQAVKKYWESRLNKFQIQNSHWKVNIVKKTTVLMRKTNIPWPALPASGAVWCESEATQSYRRVLALRLMVVWEAGMWNGVEFHIALHV
ncbi:hypothetical protein E2C01_022073 [Portunus trituberculatus]|uniref:Uncharacterized protein n=1 Tax=Portunus trituberculatus TaxID=210409 RepID=A0A5B7E4G1_PORTR|nr:hypothetical protein [Portunus trituberculatus]